MTCLMPMFGQLIHEMIRQKLMFICHHAPLRQMFLYKIPCAGENHGKKGMVYTDFLMRKIPDTFAVIPAGEQVAQKSP